MPTYVHINLELLVEKRELEDTLDEISSDMDTLNARYEHAKQQNDHHEADIQLFSRKIHSQQIFIKYD